MTTETYEEFISSKKPTAKASGISGNITLSDHMFPFQRAVTEFALRQAKAALFLDTGLGKTACELEFCHRAAIETGNPSLILTPLAVARQIEREGHRWGYDCRVIREHSDVADGINICNYDRLDKLHIDVFGCVALDESSILKAFTGKTTRSLINSFSRTPFRLAATATPAPNDVMELGQHSDFLGVMESPEMLSRWFITDQTQMGRYRLKKHATNDFWDWVASWARMAVLPSDLGFEDAGYVLQPLHVHKHKAASVDLKRNDGALFLQEVSATEVHNVKRQTADARADVVADLVGTNSGPWLVWCDTDYEADALIKRMPYSVEVRGSHSAEKKESAIAAFETQESRVLITKPSCCGFGLNFQFCHQMAFVGRSFSYEMWYQAVRRCWRFGQKMPVDVHLVVADGEDSISRVIDRKADGHEMMKKAMREAMIRAMARQEDVMQDYNPTCKTELPTWLTA